MQIRIETIDPIEFVKRYTDALDALVCVSRRGSDKEHAAATEIAQYRSFFPDAPTADQSDRLLEARRKLSPRERALEDGTDRWDIQNVLYMLGPEMRTWRHGSMEIIGPSSVILMIEETEQPSATGVIRQIVECAGGKLVEPPEPPRSGWFSFLKR